MGSEYCEHGGKHNKCVLCLDEFRLELLRGIDMLLFEKGIQGRITETVKGYAKANDNEVPIQS